MASGKYTYHKDIPNNQWNVYDPYGNYVCSFSNEELDDMKELVRKSNEELDSGKQEQEEG